MNNYKLPFTVDLEHSPHNRDAVNRTIKHAQVNTAWQLIAMHHVPIFSFIKRGYFFGCQCAHFGFINCLSSTVLRITCKRDRSTGLVT